MADLNLDLAKQAFKLNSKTYNDHDTGTFLQRIINDPERVVSSLADIMDNVFEIISSLIMIIYISTLNIYIGSDISRNKKRLNFESFLNWLSEAKFESLPTTRLYLRSAPIYPEIKKGSILSLF